MSERAPIHVLSKSFAARIAAGEVVERPSSVVKELLENSLDAGATRIDVEVVDGGRTSIAVIDDGHGIGSGEIELAFARFATSKISEDAELAAVETLGFRGEALPSVASVSIVEMVSRGAGEDSGTRLLLEYGDVRARETVGVPVGTTVRVRELFSNVPARRRFLSSASGELTRVNSVVSSYALARPDVALKLTANESVRFATTGSGALRDAVTAVYGAEAGAAVIDLPPISEDEATAISAVGLVSAPSFSRGNRNYITIALNGRWIRSRRISFAIEQAFHGFLPERRFPMAVVDIRAPLGDVDVNVHPTKAEVKFLREQAVFGKQSHHVYQCPPARSHGNIRKPGGGAEGQLTGELRGVNQQRPRQIKKQVDDGNRHAGLGIGAGYGKRRQKRRNRGTNVGPERNGKGLAQRKNARSRERNQQRCRDRAGLNHNGGNHSSRHGKERTCPQRSGNHGFHPRLHRGPHHPHQEIKRGKNQEDADPD